MAVFSATFATLIGSLTELRCTVIAFAVSRSLAECCLGNDVTRYRDGNFAAGAVYAAGIQLGFWSLLFSHITFCLPLWW